MPKLQLATSQQMTARRKELFLAYITRIFAALQKDGTKPVNLGGPLGPHSEILTGLRMAGESTIEAQVRIAGQFCRRFPLLCDSDAVEIDPT